MEKTFEKLEHIEEVIGLLILKMNAQETHLNKLIEVEPISYQEILNRIWEKLVESEAKNIEPIRLLISALGKKVEVIPKVIPVKHYYNFDTKSKFIVRIALSMFVVLLLSFSSGIFLLFRNHALAGNAEKFSVISANYPIIAHDVDSLYLIDREGLMKDTGVKLIEQHAYARAKLKEIRTKLDYQKAQEERRNLSKKKKHIKD